jgi:hypothetical protein
MIIPELIQLLIHELFWFAKESQVVIVKAFASSSSAAINESIQDLEYFIIRLSGFVLISFYRYITCSRSGNASLQL